MENTINMVTDILGLKVNFIDISVFRHFGNQEKVKIDNRKINNLYMILSGSVTYEQPQKKDSLVLLSGDIVWLPYRSNYSCFQTEIETLCLDFLMEDKQGNIIVPPPDIVYITNDKDKFYYHMYESAMAKQMNMQCDFAFRAVIYSIFANLFSDVNLLYNKDSTYMEINEAIQTIERSPQSNESIAEIAKKCGLSVSALRSKFKQYTGGITPVEYRNSLRIQKAKELLISSSCPVERISDELGFYDTSHFIKVFKKITGKTPYAYKIEFIR